MTSKNFNLKIAPMMPSAQQTMSMMPLMMTPIPPFIMLSPVTKEKLPISLISQPVPPTTAKPTNCRVQV